MPDWRDEFLENIKEAEKANPVNSVLVEHCSLLQDRIAFLEAQLAAATTTPPQATPNPASPDAADPSTAPPSSTSDPQLALDLTEALRSRNAFESRLRHAENETSSLRTRVTRDAAQLASLRREKAQLERKVKDRDEELAQKRKHYEDIHDEQITLTLQLNVAEKERDVAKKENKMLTGEVMKLKEREVDRMNEAMGGMKVGDGGGKKVGDGVGKRTRGEAGGGTRGYT